MTEPPLSDSFLQSTPYVRNSLEEMMTTVGEEQSVNQWNSSITVSAAKQSVDTGINESALTLKPTKRRLDFNESESSVKTKRNNRFRLSTNSGRKTSIDMNIDDSSQDMPSSDLSEGKS